MEKKQLTLTEIGEKLGLSKSTVQRAMANDPRCNPATAERVRKLADELGYRPDPIFAALASRRGRGGSAGIPLAYLVDEAPGRDEMSYYTPPLVARATELGYRIEKINLRTWDSPRRLWKILFSRGVAGILARCLRAEHSALLEENDIFPLVCVGRTDPLPFNTVRPSIQFAVHQVWQRMTQLGYRRIGAAVLQHEPMVEDDFSRYSAVLGCQGLSTQAEGAPIPPLTTSIRGPSQIVPWVREHRPDAVIGFHVRHYYELRDAGFKIPEDIGFASLHLFGGPGGNTANGLIAGIAQDYALISRSSVNLLDQMIRHGERGVPEKPVTLMVHSEWLDGRSLPSKGASGQAEPAAKRARSRVLAS